MDLDAACADEVFENFVEQDEVGLVAEQFQDVIAAGGNTRFVVFADDFVAGFDREATMQSSPRSCSPCPCRRASPCRWQD